MIHYLKIKPIYFLNILTGQKTFEVRSKVDRNFRIGDVMFLREIDDSGEYTGRNVRAQITYILDDPFYCKENMVILGFSVLGSWLEYDER